MVFEADGGQSATEFTLLLCKNIKGDFLPCVTVGNVMVTTRNMLNMTFTNLV